MQKIQNYIILPLFLLSCLEIRAVVDDITGDTGTPQSGSLTITGGTSGANFDTSSNTITLNFDFISLPPTSATQGQIIFGSEAVVHAFPTSNQNFFVGNSAGNFSLSGGENSGFGVSALNSLTSGSVNTAVGKAALVNLQDGSNNTAVGAAAGDNLLSGAANVLIGTGAGSAYTNSESYNIVIGDGNPGVNGESNTIRIGTGGQQTDCYVDGIHGSTIDFDTGLPVFVDANSKLGTIVSSIRFKDCVCDMGDDSNAIFKLRPVSYALKSDKKGSKQFGLIAEEVSEVFPDLVVFDKEGSPFAVRYHELPVLLLNELQEMKKEIQELKARIKHLEHKK